MESQFGNNLKRLRVNNGYSQRELAKIICVGNSTIARYESDGAYPTKGETRQKLLEALNCTEAELFGYSDGFSSKEQNGKTQVVSFDSDGNMVKGKLVDCLSCNPEDFIFVMNNHSMDKTIHKGSLVCIKPITNATNIDGKICLFTQKSTAYLLRAKDSGKYYIMEPESTDPAFEPVLLTKSKTESFKIHGIATHAINPL